MRVYLDACCFNRPFDDPGIDRNHLEAEAVVAILSHVQQRQWFLIGSSALRQELSAGRDSERREAVLGMLAAHCESIEVGQAEYDRYKELVQLGFRRMDSLHIACAEAAQCDVLLTTDDQLLRKGAKYAARLRVEVRNPVDWLLEQKP
ncbi:MAG: PIN domain-containing protein [Planctomycetota bacterium]|nr:PIN domain-containing protein [Planctomycetota bacterium]